MRVKALPLPLRWRDKRQLALGEVTGLALFKPLVKKLDGILQDLYRHQHFSNASPSDGDLLIKEAQPGVSPSENPDRAHIIAAYPHRGIARCIRKNATSGELLWKDHFSTYLRDEILPLTRGIAGQKHGKDRARSSGIDWNEHRPARIGPGQGA